MNLCPNPPTVAVAFYTAGGHEVCYPNCTRDETLDLFDFLCFIGDFNSHGQYADCNGDGELDLFDFFCFVNAFNAGC